MSGDGPYEAWRRARSDATPSCGFTERVMDGVRAAKVAPVRPAGLGERLLSRGWVAAALVVAAVAVSLLRLGLAAVMILGAPTGGF